MKTKLRCEQLENKLALSGVPVVAAPAGVAPPADVASPAVIAHPILKDCMWRGPSPVLTPVSSVDSNSTVAAPVRGDLVIRQYNGPQFVMGVNPDGTIGCSESPVIPVRTCGNSNLPRTPVVSSVDPNSTAPVDPSSLSWAEALSRNPSIPILHFPDDFPAEPGVHYFDGPRIIITKAEVQHTPASGPIFIKHEPPPDSLGPLKMFAANLPRTPVSSAVDPNSHVAAASINIPRPPVMPRPPHTIIGPPLQTQPKPQLPIIVSPSNPVSGPNRPHFSHPFPDPLVIVSRWQGPLKSK